MTGFKAYEDRSNEQLILEYLDTKEIEIKQEIVLRYSHIVTMIAKQMRGVYINFAELSDIVNEGIITLMAAVDKFDPSKNVEFETYASLRIRGTIIDLARKQDWLPRSYRKIAKEIEAADSELFNKLGRHPTDDEIAEKLGMETEKYLKLLSQTNLHNILSLDTLINSYMEEGTGYTQPKDTDINNMPEQVLSKKELHEKINDAILSLRENEQMTISLYYKKNLTMREIASVLGVKEPRVSQIHANAIRKLKTALENYVKI